MPEHARDFESARAREAHDGDGTLTGRRGGSDDRVVEVHRKLRRRPRWGAQRHGRVIVTRRIREKTSDRAARSALTSRLSTGAKKLRHQVTDSVCESRIGMTSFAKFSQ